MIAFGYLGKELRRRWGRAVVTALGLAAGVGLVMGIIGVSAGLSAAQGSALSPLSSVGTDIIVTRTVGATDASVAASPSPTNGPGQGGGGPRGGGFFGGGGPGGGGLTSAVTDLNAQDQAALLNANSSVLTDLSKLGPAGTPFVHDFFVPGTLITFPDAAVQEVASVPGVQLAVPGLSLQALHESGTVPQQVDTFTTGGQTITSTQPPAPLTDAEQAAVEACIRENGGFTRPSPQPRPSPGASPGPGNDGDGGFGRGGVLQKCLPARIQQYNAQVVIPTQTITRILNPPSTNTQTKSYTVAAVDPANQSSGLITAAQVTSGSWFTSAAASEVLVNTAYASTNKITAGQTLTLNGTDYTVRGLVAPTLTGNVSDIYFDLNTLQTLSTNPSRVNEVLVKVKSAGDVDQVAAAIQEKLPGAQVLTAKSLANQVTGSLANAQSLAASLGGALAVIILLAAFLIAALLTTSSVGKRVREIGTLRAIGWRKGRVVRQIIAESLAIGVVGALFGIAVGFGVAAAVNAFGPTLTSTTSGLAVGASTVGSLFHQGTKTSTDQTIHLQAIITSTTVVLGVACALLGGLLAGALGGWRAARLSPAVALRDLG
ncbi:MAG: putative transport system permease protein [Chloroflexota bacterium]|nr:putative transport system permease protein [Chloroflexota bacterium]